MRPIVRLVAVVIAAAALVAACSGSATPSPSAATSPSPAASPSAAASASPGASASPVASPSPATSASPAASTTVMVADSSLGQILVDGAGRTLYAFTNDTAGDSTCYDACATAWPPLVVSDEITVGAGLDDSDFSTTTRTGGATQVKIGDWPLYYFASDAAPGDTNGQGLNDKWYVVSPSGELIKG